MHLKTNETLEIEEQLRKTCRKKRLYGCEEVTIGFYNSGHGNEICDFMTMDSKGIIMTSVKPQSMMSPAGCKRVSI